MDALLIELFSRSARLSALEIQAALSGLGKRVSLRAVYKSLARLMEAGVVVKYRDQFSPSLVWILSRLEQTERLFELQLQAVRSGDILPKEGETRRWKFNDLVRMDKFWVQLIVLLFQTSSSKVMFEWIPRFWFDLIHAELDQETQRVLGDGQNHLYMIIGGDSYLDRLPSKEWSPTVYSWSYAQGPFHSERQKYYCVIDDVVLTVTLNHHLAATIDTLFERIEGPSDIDPAELHRVLHQTTRSTISLTRSSRKAAAYRKKFVEYFGITNG